MWLIHRSYCKVFCNVQEAWERNILIRRTTHLCPVRRANDIFDSSNTTRGLLFRKWFYPLYLLGTPQDIFFLLFSAMHFFKVRKIINYLRYSRWHSWHNRSLGVNSKYSLYELVTLKRCHFAWNIVFGQPGFILPDFRWVGRYLIIFRSLKKMHCRK
jgi:hypothetical protein